MSRDPIEEKYLFMRNIVHNHYIYIIIIYYLKIQLYLDIIYTVLTIFLKCVICIYNSNIIRILEIGLKI